MTSNQKSALGRATLLMFLFAPLVVKVIRGDFNLISILVLWFACVCTIAYFVWRWRSRQNASTGARS